MEISTTLTHSDLVQMVQERAAQSTNWTDSEAAALMTLISEILADIGVSNNAAILIAAREAFINIARRTSSIYAGARFLGVKLHGKSPAVTSALLTNAHDAPVTYPRHTPVRVNGKTGFLMHGISLAAGASETVDIEIGYVVTTTVPILEQRDLQSFTLPTKNFAVSSVEVCTQDPMGNQFVYDVIEAPLITANVGSYAVSMTYDDSGAPVLLFGGSGFARAPDKGHTLIVKSFVSGGSADNNDTQGLAVELVDDRLVAGKTVSSILGGDDEKAPEYYKVFGPILALSGGRLSRPDEWKAAILAHAGVADCTILSQRDVAPNDPTWQNVLRVCVLPKAGSSFGGVNPNPSSAAWQRLLDTLAKYKPFHVVQTWNPTRILINVVVEVAVHSWYTGDLRDVQTETEARINAMFKPRMGLLGRMLALDDISEAARYSGTNKLGYVDYVRVLSPTQDIYTNSNLEYIGVRSLRVSVVYSQRSSTDGITI